ncbi:hypothetical protein ACJX0J_016586, partial [Zea mays]
SSSTKSSYFMFFLFFCTSWLQVLFGLNLWLNEDLCLFGLICSGFATSRIQQLSTMITLYLIPGYFFATSRTKGVLRGVLYTAWAKTSMYTRSFLTIIQQ